MLGRSAKHDLISFALAVGVSAAVGLVAASLILVTFGSVNQCCHEAHHTCTDDVTVSGIRKSDER